MKVTKIELAGYLNFKDKEVIDLTYPHGHSKAGQPLDKVCFIGQSGTGKTTLLNLIKYFSFEDYINPETLDQRQFSKENVGIHFSDGQYNYSKWSGDAILNDPETITETTLGYLGEQGLVDKQCKNYILEHFSSASGVKLISFPSDTMRNFQKFKDIPLNYEDVIDTPEDEMKKPIDKRTVSEKRENYLAKRIWDFSSDKVEHVWDIVVDQITDYEPIYGARVNELIGKLRDDKVNAVKYSEEFEAWLKDNENPLKKIVHKCIDTLLAKFNLKVNTEIDFNSEEHRQFGRLQQLSDNVVVPSGFMSTGTLQILLTSIPLSVLDIQEAIVLFDEPERSLFPDTQIGLIKEYTSLASDSQFFFATHSPIVASAFDPCERIILNFDEYGKVFHTKGDAPEGDDPNDILHRDFGLENILEEKGQESLKRFTELKSLIHSETDPKRKEGYMSEYLKIANLYRF